uniref:Hepatic nuclear factor 4, beta n=1 Tax=Poecilia reticulata TaxID=8081 RepID=A0A3P9QJC5_POERE
MKRRPDDSGVLKPAYRYAPESVSTSSASQTYGGGSRCFICADRATGKHYGAPSCDGCKGFFRRSIRSNQTYNCRFNRQCVVDKDKRNQCRYCRLRKCFKAGMRKEAVQNERDCINPHRAKGQLVGTLSINVLLQAENRLLFVLFSPQSRDIGAKKTARVGDVFESMKQQLLLLVEWAKHIPEFCSLHIDDRVTLLRTHSAEHLILGAARRSLPYNDVILLGNDFVIFLRGAELEVSRVAIRIQEELVKPLRELDITDKEFACLRAIVFFAPGHKIHSLNINVTNMPSSVFYGYLTLNSTLKAVIDDFSVRSYSRPAAHTDWH